MRKIVAIILLTVMMLSLCACGTSFEDKVTTLVQGNIDSIYLGVNSEEYVKLVSSSEADLRESYEEGLEAEAEVFAYYFDIEYLEDDLKDEIIELYKVIYSNSKYVVNPATKLDDNTYAVKVEIYPIDIFDLVTDDAVWEEGLTEWNEKYYDVEVENMTDEEYMEYDRDWADAIIAMCYEQMPNLGYMDSKTIVIQVVKDTDGAWMISDDDMGTIDELMILYP